MRTLLALTALLLATPALAQNDAPRRNPERPLDRGPFTPEASRAFRGGGVVLEGPPGAPAPPPQALPPSPPR